MSFDEVLVFASSGAHGLIINNDSSFKNGKGII
jgi:hypothetical protein